MTRTTTNPPAFDLVRLRSGKAIAKGAFHVIDEDDDRHDAGHVRTVCGRTGEIAEKVDDVDARAVAHRGTPVCGPCRVTFHYNLGIAPEKEDDDVSTTATAPKTSRAARRDTTTAKPVTKAELTKAIARAEKSIATQPARTDVKLSKAKADKVFVLGKYISADLWRLKKVVKVGETSSAQVAAYVERIEARVQERNGLRKGKS